MSGPWHPTGRARTSATSPRAHAVCDRCGFTHNLVSLQWQYQWSGAKLANLRLLVCDRCRDIPQQQFRTIILPPDPTPVMNPRPEPYGVEVTSFLETEAGQAILAEDGSALLWEMEVTPSPDPTNPALYP